MQKLYKEENGQALILFALLLVVLIGFAGLAIDGGRLYLAKSQLQKAVDAGALAGGDVFVEGITANSTYDPLPSQTKAENIATTNYDNGTYTATFPTEMDNVIQVVGVEEVPLMLMPVLGIDKSTVKAVAQVEVGQLHTAGEGSIIPIGLELNPDEPLVFGQERDLTEDPGDGVQGWYNFLDFSFIDPDPDNSGNDALGDYIAEGSPAPISIGDILHVQHGESANSNNVQTAVESRVGEVVYVPIVEVVDNPDAHGNSVQTVTVTGFAAFELLTYTSSGSEHSIEAMFIRTVLPGEIGEVTEEYGTYASELIL